MAVVRPRSFSVALRGTGAVSVFRLMGPLPVGSRVVRIDWGWSNGLVATTLTFAGSLGLRRSADLAGLEAGVPIFDTSDTKIGIVSAYGVNCGVNSQGAFVTNVGVVVHPGSQWLVVCLVIGAGGSVGQLLASALIDEAVGFRELLAALEGMGGVPIFSRAAGGVG